MTTVTSQPITIPRPITPAPERNLREATLEQATNPQEQQAAQQEATEATTANAAGTNGTSTPASTLTSAQAGQAFFSNSNEINSRLNTPPALDRARNEVMKTIAARVALGIVAINVPLTAALFRAYADIALSDPMLTEKEKKKIEEAKYTVSTEAQQKAAVAAATTGFDNPIIDGLVERIEGKYLDGNENKEQTS